MAAALCVKAASELLVRVFQAILDLWPRGEAILRADQEVTMTPGEAQTLLERSPVDSHATMGVTEWADRTLGELLRATKHATETYVGGRLDTDRRMIIWMVRHCCTPHYRFR